MSETDKPAFALQQQNTVAAQFGTWAEARDLLSLGDRPRAG